MLAIPPITFAFVSTFAFSSLDATLGYLTNVLDIPVVQIVLIRTSAVFGLALAYLYYSQTPERPFGPAGVRHLILLRGALITAGLFLGYESLHYLTLSEFMVLYCLVPFFTGILAWLFANERFTKTQAVCCVASLVGVVLVTDPFGRSVSDGVPASIPARAIDDHLPTTLGAKLIGLALCLPSVMTNAAEMVVMRLIQQQASTVQILAYISLCPASVSTLVILVGGVEMVNPNALLGWILLFGVIPLGLTAQYTLTYTTQRVPATQVAIVQYSGVVFGTLIQWMVYGNHPSGIAFIGMAIVLACGLYTALHEPDPPPAAHDEEDRPGNEEIALPLLSRPDEDEDGEKVTTTV